jgi:hypothetical protein
MICYYKFEAAKLGYKYANRQQRFVNVAQMLYRIYPEAGSNYAKCRIFIALAIDGLSLLTSQFCVYSV